MTDLVTTLREAAEPSRELDARIHAFIDPLEITDIEVLDENTMFLSIAGREDPRLACDWPHYTGNLQDALELVPLDPETDDIFHVVIEVSPRFCHARIEGCGPDCEDAEAYNRPNPALALATAAIEARIKLGEAA